VSWISVGVLSVHGVRPVLLSPVSFSLVRDFFFIVAFYLCVPEGREITGTYFARYLGWGEGWGRGVLCLDFVSGVWVRGFPLSLSGCGHLPYYILGIV